MRIIPVIDVMNGVVVRAVAGRRAEYRPVVSRLTTSTDPIEVARALLDATGATELYVADLDSIRDPRCESSIVPKLVDTFPKTMILADVGITGPGLPRSLDPYRPAWRVPVLGWRRYRRAGNLVPVIATETVRDAAVVGVIDREFMPGVAFSLDMDGGEWVGDRRAWQGYGIGESSRVVDVLLQVAGTIGGEYLILLDRTRVGTYAGQGMERLAETARGICVGDIVIGGGVGGWDDVKRLEDAGADAVLVASALHDGRLPDR